MDNQWLVTLIAVGAGSVIPALIGIILPRKKTVQYGMGINRFLGALLFQKRIWGKAPTNVVEAIVHTVQTTFQDLSFGVYLDSRKDLTDKQKTKKINEYITQTQGKNQ